MFEIGDIVKHAARKTLVFAITSRKNNDFIIRRVDKVGKSWKVNESFKGYRIPPKDLVNLTLVEKKPANTPVVMKSDIEAMMSPHIYAEFKRLADSISSEKDFAVVHVKWTKLEDYVGYKVPLKEFEEK